MPYAWSSGLAVFLSMVESTGGWPQGLLDAYIAMVPEADGYSTLPGQRPPCVLPVLYRLWASLRLTHLKDWVEYAGCLNLFLALGMVFHLPRPGWLVPVMISCTSSLLMSSSQLTPLPGLFLTVPLVAKACHFGSGRSTSLITPR